MRFGDVEQGFAEADHIFEWRYQSRADRAGADGDHGLHRRARRHDGRLKIHSDTQACFFTLDNTALILDVPFGKLQVVGGTVGGGFGGKVDVIVEPIACIAAMATNRPVKFVYDRDGGDAGLLAARGRADLHQGRRDERRADRRPPGHASTRTPAPTRATARTRRPRPPRTCPGPYTIPNVYVDSYCVYTNRTPSSAMRGFGVTIGDFALESQMDRIARALDLDPLQLRLKNAYRDGDMKAHRKVAEGTALIEVIQKAAELVGHELPAEYRAMSSTEAR